jgi:hypothetical protein
MRSILPQTAIAALLSCGALMAQSTTPSTPQNMPSQSPTTQAPMPSPAGAQPTEATNQAHIAPGSVIPVQLTKTIDAKKAKTGEEVVAKVTQDMKTQSGQVLVPKDTKVIGHVTEAQARHKDEKESQLGIAFNQAVLNNQQVELPMSIQAVIGPQTNNNESATADNGGGQAPAPSGSAGAGNSPMGGRSPNAGMGGETAPTAASPSGGETAQQTAPKRPQINGQTQGVIGISNVSLSQSSNAQEGSVLKSDKNNVKLESGTMLLLKVSK